MQTRRSILSQTVGAGALTAVAGLSGLLNVSSQAFGDERDRERRDERKYPKIHSALEALRSAREELHDAGEDFHGHKDEAMKAVDSAIRQLEIVVEEHPH